MAEGRGQLQGQLPAPGLRGYLRAVFLGSEAGAVDRPGDGGEAWSVGAASPLRQEPPRPKAGRRGWPAGQQNSGPGGGRKRRNRPLASQLDFLPDRPVPKRWGMWGTVSRGKVGRGHEGPRPSATPSVPSCVQAAGPRGGRPLTSLLAGAAGQAPGTPELHGQVTGWSERGQSILAVGLAGHPCMKDGLESPALQVWPGPRAGCHPGRG